jgi:hypothetical protein
MIASGRHPTAEATIQVMRRWATLAAGIDVWR